jgi:hypothetical protein
MALLVKQVPLVKQVLLENVDDDHDDDARDDDS